MRRYRGKKSKTPCVKCRNHESAAMQCLISKSKHQYNYFGVSRIPCLNFDRKEIVNPNLTKKEEGKIQSIRSFFYSNGYDVTGHFIERLIQRGIDQQAITKTISYAVGYGKVKFRYDYRGVPAKAYIYEGVTVIQSIKTGVLLTTYWAD